MKKMLVSAGLAVLLVGTAGSAFAASPSTLEASKTQYIGETEKNISKLIEIDKLIKGYTAADDLWDSRDYR